MARRRSRRTPDDPIPAAGRLLGVDLGSVRIGIAVSDAGQAVATPRGVVARGATHDGDHLAIGRHAGEIGAVGLIVGLPLALDGSLGPAARGVLEEVAELRATTGLPVATYDERLTTVTADRSLQAQGLDARARRQVVDQVAATVLLQAWLDHRSAERPATTEE